MDYKIVECPRLALLGPSRFRAGVAGGDVTGGVRSAFLTLARGPRVGIGSILPKCASGGLPTLQKSVFGSILPIFAKWARMRVWNKQIGNIVPNRWDPWKT